MNFSINLYSVFLIDWKHYAEFYILFKITLIGLFDQNIFAYP